MMTRKKLEALEFAPQPLEEKSAIARIIEETLVLDCYIDKTPVARYKMNKNGYHEILVIRNCRNLGPVENPAWKVNVLGNAFEEHPAYFGGWNVETDEKSAEEIERFTGYKTEGVEAVIRKERDYRDNKRERAIQKKADRIDALMAQVPTLPDGVEDWVGNVIFGGLHYMFQTEKRGVYYCTACEKTHINKKAKEYQSVTCSRTGEMAIIRKRKQEVEKEDRMLVLQKLNEFQTVARHFKVAAKWDGNGRTIQFFEEIRYMLGREQDKGSFEAYYGQGNRLDEFEQNWWDTNPVSKHCFKEYLYPYGIKEALEGTIYQTIPYQYMADKGMKVHYNNLMRHDELMPAYEYIVKAGMTKMAREASEEYWRIWGEEGSSMEEFLGINKQRFHRLKAINGGFAELEWLKWEEKTGKKISDEAIQWMGKKNWDPEDLTLELRRMSPIQIMNYYSRQSAEAKCTIPQIKSLWEDYIKMAEKEGMDTWDEIVYRTKELKRRHDQLIELRNARIAEEKSEQKKKEARLIGRALNKIGGVYDYQDENYAIFQPKSMEEIIFEGTTLHHCVAASDMYFDKILTGKSYILFLRKIAETKKPYYTLEIKPDGTVLQKRSEYNRQPDLGEIDRFLAKWKKELKKRLKMEIAV